MPPSAPEQTVYSYYMPEVRAVVEDVLTHDADRLNRLLRQNYKPGLDDVHEPLMDKFEAHGRANGVIGWNSFRHRYYTNGSSEAIFHLIASRVGSDKTKPLYQLEGEYQGFEAYANALGMRFTSVSEKTALSDHYYRRRGIRPHYRPGIFFLSYPSARDGNILDPILFESIVENHLVVLDLAYLGMTEPLDIDVSHPNIIAVTASMSKPFGLYYFRSGFLWTGDAVDSLYGNRWFKNVPSIMVAEAVLDHVAAQELRLIYQPKQDKAIHKLQTATSNVKPSDVWLLAYEDDGPESYVRANKRARYCLTPYYMDAEDQLESAIGDSR